MDVGAKNVFLIMWKAALWGSFGETAEQWEWWWVGGEAVGQG